MILETLDGYFDNIASAATNEKFFLEDLVDNLTIFATSNTEMADTIKNIWRKSAASATTQQFVEEAVSVLFSWSCVTTTGGGSREKLCPNCKMELWHKPDDCFELARNSARRPSVWTSKF